MGYLEERGAGAGLGYNINIPLPPGTGGQGYLAAFDRVVIPALQVLLCVGMYRDG